MGLVIFDRLQSIMNGAGNVIPPSVDGNIHPESSARNLGTYYRSYEPELISGLRNPVKPAPSSARSVSSRSVSSRVSGVAGSSGGSGAAAPSAKSLDYLNADLAKYYGMSRETAYSEALSNTAYQRAVKDMQAAGLNPAALFGSGRGTTADGVSYIKSASGGSGGSVSRRSSGGKSSGKLFSGSAYSVMSALGGIVGAAATKSAGGYWLGTSLAQGAMSALSLLTGHKG